MKYGVNEVFNTIQGEGINVGIPATFIRLQGCTVGCPWCDTKYTWMKGGTVMTEQEIVREVQIHLNPLVVITGGEPTIYNLDALISGLRIVGQSMYGYAFKIQLETSGQNELKGELIPDWVTWSPKRNLNFQAPISLQRHVAEVKWVVDDEMEEDVIVKAMDYIMRVQPMNQVYCVLMPEGSPPSKEHVDKALAWLDKYPTWRYSDRIQWRMGVK
jgi:7-carboxy-7-deazaguanine synthase